MKLKIKSVAILFILIIFVQFNGFSQLFGFPTPNGAKLVSKSNKEIVGSKFTVYQYHSPHSQREILQFYQNTLKAKGWSKMELPMAQASGAFGGRVFNFVKNDQLLVLDFSPIKAEGLIFYSISVGGFPKVQGAEGGLKQPLGMFKEPKILGFMPIYPGSKQINYSKTSTGLQAGYSASGGVEVAKGFYLQKMPQQGWNLVDQKYLNNDDYDLSKVDSTNCPTCPKIPLEAKQAMSGIDINGVTLEFKQGDKACMINIIEMGGLEGVDLTSMGIGDTIITVMYHDKK